MLGSLRRVEWLASARSGPNSEANDPWNSTPPDLSKNSRVVLTASPTAVGPTATWVSGGVAPWLKSKPRPANPPETLTDIKVRSSRHSRAGRARRGAAGLTGRRVFAGRLSRERSAEVVAGGM